MQDGESRTYDTPTGKPVSMREADQIWDRLNEAVKKAEEALEHPCAKADDIKGLWAEAGVARSRYIKLLIAVITFLLGMGVPAVWWAAGQDRAASRMAADVQAVSGDVRGVQERVQRVEVGQAQIIQRLEQERREQPAREAERLEAIRAAVKDAVRH